jgi:polyisoprenoid-binding protein YceI
MSDPITNLGRTTTQLTSAAGLWPLKPAQSTVAIQHKTMWGLVTVKGTFSTVSGEGEVLADGTARGTLTIDAASLDTGHAKRDTHLRSEDFFDVDRHPSIVFTAHRITVAAGETAEVTGELTVRGVTRPLAFTAHATEATDDAVTLTAEVAIDRADFGMTWSMLAMMTGQATVTITARFTRQH